MSKIYIFIVGVFMFVDLSAKEPPFTKSDLAKWPITKNINYVDVKKIDFSGGFQGGIHHHPCPVMGYIVSGTIDYQIEGEDLKTLKAGDVFYEPANKTITKFDNASATESATFLAIYLADDSDKTLIEMKAWKK